MKQAVIDLGFGDSGKGITTSFLSQDKKSYETIVVRTNGGHQAGHTVQYDGFRHVFSQFGSGTLQGLPTYISKYCTIYPPSLLREYEYIKHYMPTLYIDPLTMITTPWDIDYNRRVEKDKKHGSVGMGFGQTIQRNEDNYKLYFQDLFNEKVLMAKLHNIVFDYYKFPSMTIGQDEIVLFMEQCRKLVNSPFCKHNTWEALKYKSNIIFESAQGILLDMDFGFFPNVTRSNTTSKNIIELAPDLDEIYYCTRTYQTRHGNGFMTNEDLPKPILDMSNGEETNQSHKYQGEFRVTELDAELLKYSLTCDKNFRPAHTKSNLIITCFDQHPIDVKGLIDELQKVVVFDKVFISNSPEAKDIKEFIF